MSLACRVCGSQNLNKSIELGEIPVAHKFGEEKDKEVLSAPMILHYCNDCSFGQINEPIPPELLYKDYNYCFSSWKPNPHIEDEINFLGELGLEKSGRILEIGCNEGVFLKELKDKGYGDSIGIEPNPFACEVAKKEGLNVMTEFFGPEIEDKIEKKEGFDLIASRQVVEHIQDLTGLMSTIGKIIKPGGLLMFEVPDFEVPLKHGDCTALWEEHVNYFAEPSLVHLLTKYGFEIESIKRYDFSGGAIVAFARFTGKSETVLDKRFENIKDLFSKFSGAVTGHIEKLKEILVENKNNGVKNLFYGSGCRANMIINASGIQGLLEGVIDDQEEKHGKFMPGSSLKVGGAKDFNLSNAFFVLSVNSENEEKVINRNSNILKNNFVSVNSPSNDYFRV